MHSPRPAPVRLTMVLAAMVVGLAARSGAAGTPARTMLELKGSGLPAFEPGWERRTFWDLRALAPHGAGATARTISASVALPPSPPPPIAEGIALLPAGPREVRLVRELLTGPGAAVTRLVYRFVATDGTTVARLEGPLPAADGRFVPDHGELLEAAPLAPNGMTIPYPTLHAALQPGHVGFLQYTAQGQNVPLTSIHPGWTSVQAMIATDASNVSYQPDPGDPGSAVTLPEVWDFTGLAKPALARRTFNTTRDDLAGASCPEVCAVRDLSALPADGTWQSWLKIDRYDGAGARATRDLFFLNDNDTGADPSIDVPYLVFDELNVDDRTQICFDDSAGGAARFLRFLRFTGATPATAAMHVGDTWTSGFWTSCNDASGLRLTLASTCGNNACYPACSISPRARGMIGLGAGFRSTIVEDGFVHVAAGNYVPALLMRQDTDLQAGINFLGTCNLGTTRERSFDYFWVQEHYGLLALVSSPTDGTGTLPPDDWSSIGNVTDHVDVTWGPYPPYQIEATACLNGTLVRWSLPADGSNPTGAPGISDWGYVVAWGTGLDAETLADWSANANHTPLPGQAGYLAAPPGGEPTSAIVTGWAGASIDATVTTALRYTDPDLGDLKPYRSAAFFKVTENPARLDPSVFRVGQAVAPFVSLSGSDLALAWPAVPGASGYRLRVFDLATKQEIPCPAGLDCSPITPSAIHNGGAVAPQSFGYVALAVDACGAASNN
ncbi:MAG TPA: hypothetical protein VFC25_02975 [Verrucomicrobiae bacterium]|nr:hypothetical protein [Verrucomicrobiae bacterium]